MDDVELVRRVVSGDSAAAGEFVERFRNYLYVILAGRLKGDEADDAFQELFVKLWERDYRVLRLWHGRGTLAAYLATVARRAASDWLRSRRGEIPPNPEENDETPDPAAGPEILALHTSEWAVAQQALREIAECDRKILILRHLHEQSYAEIADALSIPLNQVGVRLARALERFRRAVRRLHPDFFDGEEK